MKHVLAIDRRDHALLATNGYLLKLTNEASGIGGVGSPFLKNQVEGQVHFSSPRKYFVFSAGLQGGAILAMNEAKKPSITDRFFLGGPVSVRGFATSGLGPQAISQCSILFFLLVFAFIFPTHHPSFAQEGPLVSERLTERPTP